MNSLSLRLVVGAIALFGAGGCCGVAADRQGPSSSAGAVEADGSVHFTAIARGTTEAFPIPVKETADTSETIQSASLSGSGATSFKVLSYFPISVPNGQDVTVEVQFSPTSTGTFDAELLLQTAKMGTSQISLVGTGL